MTSLNKFLIIGILGALINFCSSFAFADEDSCVEHHYREVTCSNKERTVTFVYNSGSTDGKTLPIEKTLKIGTQTLILDSYKFAAGDVSVWTKDNGDIVNSLSSRSKDQLNPKNHSILDLAASPNSRDISQLYNAKVISNIYNGETEYYPDLKAKLISEKTEVASVPYSHVTYKFQVELMGFKPIFEKLLGTQYSNSFNRNLYYTDDSGHEIPASGTILTCKEVSHSDCP